MAKKKSVKKQETQSKDLDFTAPWDGTSGEAKTQKFQKIRKGKVSKWVDDGTQHRVDAEIDKKLAPKKLIEKGKREPEKKVKVICARCNKTFNVSKIFATEWYVCDKCVTLRPNEISED